jgi:hypothetical protein
VDYDPGVDASVEVRNPFLRENPTVSDLSLQDFGGGDGASDGDPDYTRTQFYYGQVNAGPGECTGISTVMFGSLSAAASGPSMGGIFPLSDVAAEPADGDYTVNVEVVDGAGNSRVFGPLEITLDRTPPQLTNTDVATMTVVDANGSPITESDVVEVQLKFENVAVSENEYGTRTGENQPFWGVWAANSDQELVVEEVPPEPVTTPTPTAAISSTATTTPTPTATDDPTDAATPTPTEAITSTATTTPTPTEAITGTATITPTDDISGTATVTPSPTPTPIEDAGGDPSPTPTESGGFVPLNAGVAQTDAVNALVWEPIEVLSASDNGDGTYDFTITWKLTNGLNGLSQGDTIYVYARILDGAGNYTRQTLGPAEVILTQDPNPERVYLPFVGNN